MSLPLATVEIGSITFEIKPSDWGMLFFTAMAAIATAFAAGAAWINTSATRAQLEQESLYRQLDALERAHKIVFVARKELITSLLKDSQSVIEQYERSVTELNETTSNHDRQDTLMHLNNAVMGPPDATRLIPLLEFAYDIGTLLQFNFLVPNGCDSAVHIPTAAEFPLNEQFPDQFVRNAGIIAAELLNTRKKEITPPKTTNKTLECMLSFKQIKEAGGFKLYSHT